MLLKGFVFIFYDYSKNLTRLFYFKILEEKDRQIFLVTLISHSNDVRRFHSSVRVFSLPINWNLSWTRRHALVRALSLSASSFQIFPLFLLVSLFFITILNSDFWETNPFFFLWRWLWKVREFHWRRFYSFCSFLPFSQHLSRIRFSTPRNQYLQALLLPLVPLLLFRLKEMYIHLGMLSYVMICYVFSDLFNNLLLKVIQTLFLLFSKTLKIFIFFWAWIFFRKVLNLRFCYDLNCANCL